jgi:hypothetical protein
MIGPVKSLLASALVVSVVNGHGYLSVPKVTFTAEAGDPTQFIGTIEASESGMTGTFNGAPADNVAAFTKAFGSSKYTSLKEYVTDKATIKVSGATLTCGSCDPKAEAQPLPKSTVQWAHSDTEGFTPSHEGPCEVWCDDVRTFQDNDCAANFKTAPAELPYDREACAGSSVLTFYWMAMHSSTWQVYVNCAPLAKSTGTGAASKFAVGESSSATSNSTSTTSTDAPSVATEAPSVTSAPSSTTAPSATTTPSTPSATAAPSTTSAPSTTTASTSDSAAGSASDCGSYDVAGSDSATASASDCGSYDVAGGSGDGTQSTGSQTSGASLVSSSSGNTMQGSASTATKSKTNTYQGTGSQTSFDFNTFDGMTKAGTVSPQKM